MHCNDAVLLVIMEKILQQVLMNLKTKQRMGLNKKFWTNPKEACSFCWVFHIMTISALNLNAGRPGQV